MRRDFHFHVIYVLARHAGIKENIAYKIAYSSEHVDNQKEKHVLLFKNGGQTQTYRSAHKMLSRRMYTDRTGMGIYMPFHFFPSCEGHDFYDRILCKANSPGVKALKIKMLSHMKEKYASYLLGVNLHVLADTFAHKGFNALKDFRNKAKKLSVENDFFLDTLFKAKPLFLPPFGHLQVLTCPDEPACVWSYENYKGELIIRNNIVDYMLAVDYIFDLLSKDLFKIRPDWFEKHPPSDLTDVKKELFNMLSLNMSSHNRLKAWEQAWALNYFSGIETPMYDENLWFDQSIKTTGKWLFKKYERKEGYKTSDWKHFQDALAQHIFYCKHEIFPEYNIFI